MMNERLRAAYAPALATIRERFADRPEISEPLFMHVPDGYSRVAIKLMVVGQETFGWREGLDTSASDPVLALCSLYAGFNLGEHCRRSPFWQAAHKLHRLINPEGPERAFLWSNLVKVDQNNRRPEREVEDFVTSLGLVQSEISITTPDAVVFFTGPHYDDRLKATFPGIGYEPAGEWFHRLRHDALPVASFRSYHPRFLRFRRRWRTLDEMAEAIRALVPRT